MNLKIGWTLAVLTVALGYYFWGWRGVVVAASGAVFWLLLQFSQAMRAMRAAGGAPVGKVPSAVMLHARLVKGKRLVDVIQLTRSLGEQLSDSPETWRWRDEAGASVTVVMQGGRVADWTLARPVDPADPADPAEANDGPTPAA